MKKIFPWMILSSVMLLTACTSDDTDIQAFLQNPGKASYIPNKNKIVASLPAVEYQPAADPFSNSVGVQNIVTSDDNGNIPDAKLTLDTSPVDSLKLVGVWMDPMGNYALLKSGDGVVHKVKVNDKVGLYGGVVTTIKTKEISIKEVLPDNFGGQSISITVIKSE